jgi:2-dehydropantoate 2-reductase
MRICVIGAGGMGSTYGGRLAAAGQDVSLVDVLADHVRRVADKGLIIEGPAGIIESRPAATTDPREVGRCDLVVVFVKSMHTAEAARAMSPLLTDRTAVLTLQNGYGNAEILADTVGSERVLAGVSYRSAELLAPGRAREDGVEKETILGCLAGGESDVGRSVVEIFNRAGLLTRFTDNPVNEMWGKLLVNCGGNAICAIANLDIGQLARNRPAMELVDLTIGEVVRLAQARGVELPYSDPHAKVRENWINLEGARASTHQDILRGRPTEIDALNGAIVRESEHDGLDAPYNRAVTLLIKALEAKQKT